MRESRSRDAFLLLFIVLFLIPVLSGCLRRPGPSARLSEAALPDPEALYRQVLGYGEQVRTLRGTARVRLQTEQEKVTVDAVIVCDRAGRLRFEVLDWLNHVVFLAIFGPQRFLTYSVAENRYMEGPDDADHIQEMLGIPLKAEQLAALALGDPFFLPMTNPSVNLSVDRGTLLLDVEGSGLGPRYLVWLDESERPEHMIVMRAYGTGGAASDLRVDYGRYREDDSVSFPHLIRVADTGSQGVLEVAYQRVLLNEPLEEGLFQFTPPAGATQSTGPNS